MSLSVYQFILINIFYRALEIRPLIHNAKGPHKIDENFWFVY